MDGIKGSSNWRFYYISLVSSISYIQPRGNNIEVEEGVSYSWREWYLRVSH